MDAEEILRALEARMDAKVRVMVELITGQKTALVVLIEALHRTGALSFEETADAMGSAFDALTPENQASQQGATLRSIREFCLAQLRTQRGEKPS